jgi:Flp pilus assembly protein TadD
VRAEYNLGLSYVGLDRDSDAVSAYQTAITWQQNAEQQDPQPYLDLGILLLQEGHPDQATSYLQNAVTFGRGIPARMSS